MFKNKRLFALLLLLVLTGVISSYATHAYYKRKANSVTLKEHYKYDLAVTAIFQNEAPYLKEWIEYHKMLGVQHFYLFDNASRDNPAKVLQPYIASGLVDLIHESTVAGGLAEWDALQKSTYEKALNLARGEVKWLAIIDVDEFLTPLQKDNLIDFLTDYDAYPSVAVNWQLFGTSAVVKIPEDKLMIEMLVMKAPPLSEENRHIKSIVRPEYVRKAHVHDMVYKKPYRHVDSNGNAFASGGLSEVVVVDKIQLNHYWTRDEDFFYTVKLAHRARCESKEQSEARKDYLSQVRDHSMDRFIEPLRKQMELE